MPRRYTLIAILLILALPLVTAGCKKKQPEEVPPPPPVEEPQPAPEPAPAPKPVPEDDWKTQEPVKTEDPRALAMKVEGQLKTVYFDFDRYDLDDADRAILKANAQVMKDNGSMSFVVEGHCDERGTIEYNLALGERRANSVRDYLTSLGVSASRLRIKSYGEERPAVEGSNESAWAKNRRAEFKVD